MMGQMWLRTAVLGCGVLLAGVQAQAQAAAIPSAQVNGDSPTLETNRGKKLLGEMVQALGGDAWKDREDWIFQGKSASFYKGQPHTGAPGFQEYYRMEPFAERIIVISHFGDIIPHDHSDVAVLWNKDGGFEVTYKGVNPLPQKDVEEYMRRRAHSLDVVVKDWLRRPDTIVTYEGSNMVERRLAEQVSVLTAGNDGVTLELDEATHLPLSLSYQWRDPVYKDLNTDVQEYDDYHTVQGIATPYSVTNLHNGDMTSQRFLSKVQYNAKLAPDLFDPDRALSKKGR